MEYKKVKIKTWEAMEQEFGLKPTGSIDCKCSFTEDMEAAMPKDRVVRVRIPEAIWPGTSYSISNDMIEDVIDPVKPKPTTVELIFAVLRSYQGDLDTVENAFKHDWVMILATDSSGFFSVSGYSTKEACLTDLKANVAEYGKQAQATIFYKGKPVDSIMDKEAIRWRKRVQIKFKAIWGDND